MAKRQAVVIGASAGGVEALSSLVSALPDDFAASIFVVVHIPANATSVLPRILSRSGSLPAVHAVDGEQIESGQIYVAAPDRHLIVERGVIRTPRGPRENGHRPAIDPLFRSAAKIYGNKLIGIVLSGNLDDGTAGLQVIKSRGGVVIVQDPGEALHPGMPRSAIQNVNVDHVLSVDDIAPMLVKLLRDSVPKEERPVTDETQDEIEVTALQLDQLQSDDQPGTPSGFTCPECNGGLWEIQDGKLVRYRCRVGHAYSAETLLAEQGESAEAALWAALRALEENAAFARRLARRNVGLKFPALVRKFTDQAARTEQHAKVIRDMLLSGPITAQPPAEAIIGPEGA